MKNKSVLLIILLLSLSFIKAQSTDEKYIAKFAKTAVEEMHIYKIPASITLAQGLLETADGQSELAQNANNHFGIKCKKEWTGATYRYTDDAYMECFRKYDSPWESYRDHSKFLAERPYYKALFTLPMTDYKAWAHGLKKAGYATNPRYAPLLIAKIEKYNLNQFDHITPEEVEQKLVQLYPSLQSSDVLMAQENIVVVEHVEEPVKIVEEKIVKAAEENTEIRNATETILKSPASRVHPLDRIERHPNKNMRYIVVTSGETLSQISRNYNLPLERLKNYNDIDDVNKIKVDQYIFLEQKKNKGKSKYYIVQKGDDLVSISQKEGIRLSSLLKRNRMKKGDSVSEGQKLYLKGRKKK